jgi:hypothetical protein
LKQVGVYSPLLFNFAVEYAIRGVQINKDSLKLSGTPQFLGFADGVNILDGSVHITSRVQKKTEPLL